MELDELVQDKSHDLEEHTLGELLAAHLEKRNWSVYKLAQKSGVPQATIGNFSKRDTSPTVETLRIVCNRGLGITLEQFFSTFGPTGVSPEEEAILQQYRSLSDDKKETFTKFLNSMTE